MQHTPPDLNLLQDQLKEEMLDIGSAFVYILITISTTSTAMVTF